MGRLKQIGNRVAALPRRLPAPLGAERTERRDAVLGYRSWYKTARWQRLRWDVLVRDGFQCRTCGQIEVDTSKLVADHRRAHRGDEALFWDADNLQCLCKACHDRDKQAEERRGWLGANL